MIDIYKNLIYNLVIYQTYKYRMGSMDRIQEIRKGSTPLLILSVLVDRKMYGYQIMRELEKRSEGYFTMTAALLYPALHQLEEEGLLEGEWQDQPGKRRRKYYTITAKGKKALQASRNEWQNFLTHLFITLEFPGKS
jgi:PadR family transcriptional regulator PadR